MSGETGRSIRKAATVLATSTAALSSQLPGISFFTNFAPPIFWPLKLMTGGLTLAIFVWVFFSPPKAAAQARTGVTAVIVAVVLAIAYSALLEWTTVLPPPESGVAQRFQIGFGLEPFSLTPEGIELIQTLSANASAENLMLAKGAFRSGGPALIWKEWTIRVASIALTLVFLGAYIAWAFGLACIALKLIGKRKTH